MKTEALTVFDDYLVADTQVVDYTGLDYTEELGRANPLAIEAEVELHSTKVTGGASLTVAMEHSANGKDWEQKNTYSEVVMPTPPGKPQLVWTVPGTYAISGGETLPTRPSHRLVRLRLTFDGGGQTHEGRIILRAIPRSRVRKHREPTAAADVSERFSRQVSTATAIELAELRAHAPHPETVAELRRLAAEVAGQSDDDRRDHLAFHLSGRARRELVTFAASSSGLTTRAQRELLEAARRDLLGRALDGSGGGPSGSS